MSATYTCDLCGYQATDRALVIEHMRTAHDITDAGEVGSIEQHAGQLTLRSGEHETVIELATWLREHLGASEPAERSYSPAQKRRLHQALEIIIEAGTIKPPIAGEHLRESQPTYAIGQRFVFTQGQQVICNGHPGTVARVLAGQLAGLVEIRLAAGLVCVSACYPDCYPAPAEEGAR